MSQINTQANALAMRDGLSHVDNVEAPGSAVSWAAVLAGAVGAAALSLLLVILGSGLGFSAVSPWSMEGISATTIGFAAIAWLTFTQLAASGMGGYLAGRLRTKWAAVHTDEVYFRDTAHGFLTWAVASLLTALVLTSVMGSIVSGGVKAGAAVAGGATSVVGTVAETAAGSAATEAADSIGIEYFVDSMFRTDGMGATAQAAPQSSEQDSNQDSEQNGEQMNDPVSKQMSEVSAIPAGEVMRIFTQALGSGTLPQEDQDYIARLIARYTSISQQEAGLRVSKGFEQVQASLKAAETAAREAADTARKASAYAALWMSVTLLIGAFVASLMAVFGGRQRDA